MTLTITQQKIIKLLENHAADIRYNIRWVCTHIGRGEFSYSLYGKSGRMRFLTKDTMRALEKSKMLKKVAIKGRGDVGYVHVNSPVEDIKITEKKFWDNENKKALAKDKAKYNNYKGSRLSLEIANNLGCTDYAHPIDVAENIDAIIKENLDLLKEFQK